MANRINWLIRAAWLDELVAIVDVTSRLQRPFPVVIAETKSCKRRRVSWLGFPPENVE